MHAVILEWIMFEKFVDQKHKSGAHDQYVESPCVYIQTDKSREILRVGVTKRRLRDRYWGGTGYTIQAAMHGSGNLIFVASVPTKINPIDVERTIILGESHIQQRKETPNRSNHDRKQS